MPRTSSVSWCVAGLVLWGLAASSAVADEPKPDALTAEQILDRMSKAYANCKSYRDSGVVKTVFFEPEGKRTVEKPFTTAFVRPDRFRFEYTDNKKRFIVWCPGELVQTWWDKKPGIEQEESLGLALAGATGVSGGSAHTIPALLLPEEVGGRLLTDITEAKRGTDAKLNQVDCFRIEGKYASHPMTIWLDKQTFLVRRIDEQTKFNDFRTEETTTYEPVLDGEIADKLLEFNPPKQK